MTEPVRTKVRRASRARERRTVDDRVILFLRGSRLGRPIFAAISGLSPRSRLRQAFLRRGFARNLEALNRRDFEFFSCQMRGDIEYLPPRRGGAPAWPGVEEVYKGRDGVQRFHEEWNTEWGEVTFTPVEMVDFGDRAVFLFHGTTRGRASGLEVEQPFSALGTFDEGWFVRFEFFLEWDESLRAAGLAPDPAKTPP